MPSGGGLQVLRLLAAVVLLWSLLLCGCRAALVNGVVVNTSTNSILHHHPLSSSYPLQQQQQRQQQQQHHQADSAAIESSLSPISLSSNKKRSGIADQQLLHLQPSPLQQVPSKYHHQVPTRYSNQYQDPTQILKRFQSEETGEDSDDVSENGILYQLKSSRPEDLYPNSRLSPISKRSQRKHLKQKRHTLLALVRAAIPLSSSSAQQTRRYHHKAPSSLLSSLTPEQQEYILSQQENILSQQDIAASEEQQNEHNNRIRFEQQQQAAAAAQNVQQQSPLLYEPYHRVSPMPQESNSENIYGPWLRKRSGGVPLDGGGSSLGPGGAPFKSDAVKRQNGITKEEGNIGHDEMRHQEEEELGDDRKEVSGGSNEDELDNRDALPGQEEVNLSLQQVGNSINHAFFRSARSGARPYDVPQIGKRIIHH